MSSFFVDEVLLMRMSHNPGNWKCFRTPSPTDPDPRWKVFLQISRYPLAADFDSPEVVIGHLSEEQYRSIKPHRTSADSSEQDKKFAEGLRSTMRRCQLHQSHLHPPTGTRMVVVLTKLLVLLVQQWDISVLTRLLRQTGIAVAVAAKACISLVLVLVDMILTLMFVFVASASMQTIGRGGH
jgi:hypothetical protein